MWTHLRRAGALGASLVLIAGLLAVAPVALAVGSTPSTVQLGPPELNPKPVGLTSDIVAQVTPSDATGTVDFFDDTLGVRTPLGSAPVVDNPYVMGIRQATITLPADMAAGTYHLVAVYSGDATYASSESDPLPFTVGPRSTATLLTVSSPIDVSGATAEKGDVLAVQATVNDNDSYTPNPVAINGSVTIKLDGTTTVGQVTLPASSVNVATTGAGWTAGAHVLTATYDPGANTDHKTSTSVDWPITIVANSVQATAGVQYSTFYPYKDGYRDTDAIRGNRLEPASVAIKILSPTGRLVLRKSFALAAGAYSYAWNGRTSTGTMLAAGKYSVSQTITDGKGLAKVFTSYVTISSKRLYTYTVALTKNAKTQLSRNGGSWFGWAFTLPSATVYKKLVFAVYGRTGFPAGTFGPHDYSYCPSTTAWSPACMYPYASFHATLGWASVTGNVTRNRHGTAVRMYATGGYNTAVAYARVTVTYALLR